MRERDIHKALVERIKALGGEVRRVQWQGRSAAPDVLILLDGRHAFAEEKRPGEAPTAAQDREMSRLRKAGCEVWAINSIADIDHHLPHATQDQTPASELP